MVPAIASRIPLVRRPKAPALPLDERIAHLNGLTVAPASADHHDLVARASAVLNYAALIASDIGMPDLATGLCRKQHEVFADAGHLTGDIAVMALMPLINISRLLTRQGDGEAAYDVLTRLYRAAQKRNTAEIHGNTIDLASLTSTEADHRRVCEELWITLLVDGARALARIGRWTEAAEALAAHRGIGQRLLDGRQIQIMALMERGLDQQARDTIDSATPAEPWENTIAALLRVSCSAPHTSAPETELDLAMRETLNLTAPRDPSTAVFQARVGLTALELARDHTNAHRILPKALADVAALDAYAARDVLNHPLTSANLSSDHRNRLQAVLTASGLGAGNLSQDHTHALTEAVEKAACALRHLL
ncbi:hypothetical protein [Actinomadura sp. 3N508]|uniref:hypothetical protein n=1 Tax=Actinomadura sp. 3N508 TaxID=3375153 RepID=UPI00378D98AF